VAQMPWDPKPVQAPPQSAPQAAASVPPSSVANGLPSSNYSYAGRQNGDPRIKTEPDYQSNGYAQPPSSTSQQGGQARAQQLIQEYATQNAGTIQANNLQNRGQLALPGQQAPRTALQLPGQGQPHPSQQQYNQRPDQMMPGSMQHQQAQLQQQQSQPRIKVENESPQLGRGGFQQQQRSHPQYAQTDGADDGLEEWQFMLAQRRAAHAQHADEADRLVHDRVMQLSANLQSGLMVPLDEQPDRNVSKKRRTVAPRSGASDAGPSVPQLDGDFDEEEEKPEIKNEDADAINSDLDDSDDEGAGDINDDEDEMGDSILCTYDKVQRVKNKWKCTLKDGVMSVKGREYVFHKGMGEFEW
jgi:transcription initiation factor TFIIA large subunit